MMQQAQEMFRSGSPVDKLVADLAAKAAELKTPVPMINWLTNGRRRSCAGGLPTHI